MVYKVAVFNVDGSVTVTEQAKAPEYKQLREAVNGLIQTVVGFTAYDGLKRGTCYANEEGLLHGMQFNAKATQAWHDCLKASGRPYNRDMVHLVGPVIFYAKIPKPKHIASV